MKIIRLTAMQKQSLLAQPESGMGWQRVDVELANGRRLENCAVRNAKILEAPELVDPGDIRGIALHADET